MEHFAEWGVLQDKELGTILLHIRLGRKEREKPSQHQREDRFLKHVKAGLHGWRYIHNHQGTAPQRVTFCSGETFHIKVQNFGYLYRTWESLLYSSNGYILIITNLFHFIF